MTAADGAQCREPAVHHWGPVLFCCGHFSTFVQGMFDLQERIKEQRHQDLVRLYEENTKRDSRLAGKLCLTPEQEEYARQYIRSADKKRDKKK